MPQKYPITGGGNWSGNIWNTASGQAVPNTTVPTTSDVVTFTATETGLVTVDTTTCVCNSLTFQNAGNKLAVSSGQKLSVSGILTLISSMTLTAADTTSTITLDYSSGASLALTVPTGSPSWGGVFEIKSNTVAVTVTPSANWQVNSLLITGTTATVTVNTNTLTITNGFIANASSTGYLAGTTILNVTGGTITTTSTSKVYNSITLAGGSITIADGFRYGGTAGRTFSYSSGTITVAGSFSFVGSCTYTATSAQVPLSTLYGIAGTVTLSQALTGITTYYGSGITALNGYSVTCLNITGTGTSGGTTTFTLGNGSGGGTCSWLRTSSGIFQHNLTVNCETITIADANGVAWGSAGETLTYTAGTITWGGSITIFPSACTLTGWTGTGAMGQVNVGGTSGQTITLGSDFTTTGSLAPQNGSSGVSLAFAGAYDVTCANLIVTSSGANYFKMTANRTINITTGIQVVGVYSATPNYLVISSTSGGTKTNINYTGTLANEKIWGATLTDINATGQQLMTFCGTVNTCTNCVARTPADFSNIIGLIN